MWVASAKGTGWSGSNASLAFDSRSEPAPEPISAYGAKAITAHGNARRAPRKSAPRARRARPQAYALVLLGVAVMVIAACGEARRVASPGGKSVHVQQARLGITLRTDRHNTVTVIEYRSAVAATGHERAPQGMHVEAAELSICALANAGLVGPRMATLKTINNRHVLASAKASIRPQLRAQRLARGHCARGWVAFDVPNTTTGALMVVSDDNDDSMRWVVH